MQDSISSALATVMLQSCYKPSILSPLRAKGIVMANAVHLSVHLVVLKHFIPKIVQGFHILSLNLMGWYVVTWNRWLFNSLAPGRCGCYLKLVIFKVVSSLLLISMLWHRQAIFNSKGDKLSSSAECRIWTRVFGSESPANRMPADKPTELSRIKLKNLNSTARLYDQRAFSPQIYWAFRVKLSSGKCHKTWLIISQHWFR